MYSLPSSCVNISIQREDKNSFETLRIEDHKHVSDLLEASRWMLKFKKSDRLSAHKIPNGERIPDLDRISDIARLGTVVIKCAETGADHECAANHQIFLEQGATKRDNMTTAALRKKDYNEIDILNGRLDNDSVEGFTFKIVPESYKHEYKETERTFTFFSEKERKEKPTKIRVISNWWDWQPDKALPCWGVKIDNSSSSNTQSTRSYRHKSLATGKTCIALVTKTRFHQVKEFHVEVSISDKAIKQAKEILRVEMKERQNNIKKFTDKYCNFVYSGKFSAGIWLRAVGTAKRSKDPKGQDVTTLEERVKEHIAKHHWFWKSESCRLSDQTRTNPDPAVNVSMITMSDPAHIAKMSELEKKLKNVKNFAVFPTNWAEKSHFTPVYEIMQSQAEATGDKDLLEVSDILRKHMKEASHSDVATSMEVEDCFSEMGMDVKEKETSEKMNANYSGEGNWYDGRAERENRKTRDASFPFRSDCKSITTESEAALDKKLENIPTGMTTDGKPMTCTSPLPYVVFLGDTGTGKSTIVEKLTGEKERSSNDSESFTRSSESFIVRDGSLIVADTPGSNSRKDKVEHNIWIAGALNFQPVSRIFIVSKAEPRIDSVIDNVCKYADNFVELPFDVIGVLVTHMDLVEWDEEDFMSAIDDELGIDAVIFSWFNTTSETLLPKILETCTGKHDMTVNHENFTKLFKIPNNHRKILKFISDEVKKFSMMKEAFDRKRKAHAGLDQVDLAFEFLAYMSDEIDDAKKRMTEHNNFTFKGDSAALEAGHVLHMVNQLHTVLFDIRKACFKYQCEHGVPEVRKCPYCGLVWTRDENCSGNTVCGNEDTNVSDTRDLKLAVFSTFSFAWVNNKLKIDKKMKKDVNERCSRPMFGCGKTINWKDMATVELGREFSGTIRLCSSGTKVDPSTEWNLTGRIGEMTKEFAGWFNKQWNKFTTP